MIQVKQKLFEIFIFIVRIDFDLVLITLQYNTILLNELVIGPWCASISIVEICISPLKITIRFSSTTLIGNIKMIGENEQIICRYWFTCLNRVIDMDGIGY